MLTPSFLNDLRHDARQASRLSERRLKAALRDLDEALKGDLDGASHQTLLMLRKVFAQELRNRMGAGPADWDDDWGTQEDNAARDAAQKAAQTSAKNSTSAPGKAGGGKSSTPAKSSPPASSTPPPAEPPPAEEDSSSQMGTVLFAGAMGTLLVLGIEGTRRAHKAQQQRKQQGGM